RAVDLDGDGSNEWIGVKDTGFEVMDAEGRSYWKYDSHVTPESFDFLGFADLNGDGSQEILVRGGGAVSALRDVPQLLWRNASLHNVRMLALDGAGKLWVQSGQTVRRMRSDGSLAPQSFRAPGTSIFLGESQRKGGASRLRFFSARYADRVDLGHDL